MVQKIIVFTLNNQRKLYLSALVYLLLYISTPCGSLFDNHLPFRHTNKYSNKKPQANIQARKICVQQAETIKARHKSCFLRPDSGPCRADIIQWYFDVLSSTCYQFFWGGCQGNGNKFETREECEAYCILGEAVELTIPNFCSLSFEYGTCFGYFNRWTWDNRDKVCKRRLYSGCGGNQNNFQTKDECSRTCVSPPNNTLSRIYVEYTTCVPVGLSDLQ